MNNQDGFVNTDNNPDNPDNIDNTDKKERSVVALKYEKGYKAPKIVAKGKGYLADRILEEAEAHDVLVHTDENLAENLNRLELGSDIPPELFEIVAQIYIFADRIDEIIGEENMKKVQKKRNIGKI